MISCHKGYNILLAVNFTGGQFTGGQFTGGQCFYTMISIKENKIKVMTVYIPF